MKTRSNVIAFSKLGAVFILYSTLAAAQSAPSITEYPIPSSSNAFGIAAGPDGALWFKEQSGNIGRITSAGTITEYPISTTLSSPGIVAGPDGALWFTDDGGNKIGRITTAGVITEYLIPTSSSTPWDITAGPDGALWFTEQGGNKIGRITTAGIITEYSVPTFNSSPQYITAGPDGALWFTEKGFVSGGKIGRITTVGVITDEYPTRPADEVTGITAGPDGALWYVEHVSNQIGRITTTGTIAEYPIPAASSAPFDITQGPDGALWFTENNLAGDPANRIGQITTAGNITEYPIPTAFGTADRVTLGPDGALWYTEFNANNIGRAAFNVGIPLISGAPLPLGEVGTAYSTALSASGGTPPYSNWTVASGSLPPGLVLNPSTGVISGSPTTATSGGANFNVTVQDSTGATSIAQGFTINVFPALQITGPNSLPPGIAGLTYPPPGCCVFFTFAGGSSLQPTWSATGLPSGMSMDAGGVLHGGPNAGSQGIYHPQFTVRDSINTAATVSLDLTISASEVPPLQITTSFTLPSAAVGSLYSLSFVASGPYPPYSWRVVSGSLPPAFVLGTDGSFNGVAPAPGPFIFTLQVTDAATFTATQTFNLTVISGFAITTTTLPSGTLGTAYSQSLTATGGTLPYNWSMISGSLPSGLTLSSTGTIAGTPTTAGTQTFAVRVTDANSLSTTQTLSLTITQASCSFTISPEGQAFTSAGGSGSIAVTAGSLCAWTLSGAPAWVTIVSGASGSGNGSANYTVAANGANSDLTATITIAGLSFTIEQQAASINGLTVIGSMPHIAAEENWTTSFTVVNNTSSANQVRLNLFGSNIDASGSGNPLQLPLSLPQEPSLGVLLGTSLDNTLSPFASWIVSTAGQGIAPVQTGSAQVSTTGALGGFAIFHRISDTQEAVVPLETRNASSYLLAFDNTNGIITAIALANVSPLAANIGIVIRDDTGALIYSGAIQLPGNGQVAVDLPDPLLGGQVTANKRGTIEFDTPPGGQISVLGIRNTPQVTPQGMVTTLTSVPALANVGTGGGSFAFIASGGDGWQTTFVLVNTGSSAAPATLSFLDPTGNPLSLPLSFPQSGAVNQASSVTQLLTAGATLLIQSSAPPPALLTGSAQLAATGNISGFVIFRHNGQEAVVPMESRNASAYVLAFDNTGGTATGVAINAVSTQPVNIPVVIRDDSGNQLAVDVLPLAANGDFAGDLGQFSGTLGRVLFPATANIRGTVEFDAPAGVHIGVIGIRTPPTQTYTSLPALAE